jgi:hypothetical protein
MGGKKNPMANLLMWTDDIDISRRDADVPPNNNKFLLMGLLITARLNTLIPLWFHITIMIMLTRHDNMLPINDTATSTASSADTYDLT